MGTTRLSAETIAQPSGLKLTIYAYVDFDISPFIAFTSKG